MSKNIKASFYQWSFINWFATSQIVHVTALLWNIPCALHREMDQKRPETENLTTKSIGLNYWTGCWRMDTCEIFRCCRGTSERVRTHMILLYTKRWRCTMNSCRYLTKTLSFACVFYYLMCTSSYKTDRGCSQIWYYSGHSNKQICRTGSSARTNKEKTVELTKLEIKVETSSH